jgi:hypothetical protein
MIQCETNGRGVASVVLKKMKKGVLEGTKTGTLTREKLRENKICLWNEVKKKERKKLKGKKYYFNL